IPADRFVSAAQFAAAIATGSDPRIPVSPRARGASLRRQSGILIPLAVGLVLGAALGAALLAGRLRARDPAATTHLRRWNIVLPDSASVALGAGASSGFTHTSIALSPAGNRLAYVSWRSSGSVLMLRDLTGDSAIALPGSQGAHYPFFSPDGSWIGFFAGNVLRKVAVTGGDPVVVAPVNRVTGAAWTHDDRILLFQNSGFDLHALSASGGSTDSTVHLSTQFGEPDALPGGEWLVGQLSSGQLALLSTRSGTELAITRRGVLPLDSVARSDLLFATSPKWVAPGHLVYAAADGVLMAMPFDGVRRRVLGEPVPVLTGVRMEAGFGAGEFAIAHDGTLAYVAGRNQLYGTFAFVSAAGKLDTLPLPRGPYTQPRLSPDGSELAVQVRNPTGGWEVLLMNLRTGVTQPVRIDGNYRVYPASWLPSGRQLMVGLWNAVQGINNGARILSLDTGKWTDIHLPGSSYINVAPDGRSFAFSDWRTGDLYLRALHGDTARTSIPARGFASSFSPDGRWMAWGSVDGSVGVSPIPPTGAIHTVAEHGEMPLWAPRGDALIYRNGSTYWRVPVSTAGRFSSGRAEKLIEGAFVATFAWNHDIAPDGRLLVLLNSPEQEARALSVITGLPELLARVARERSAAR
ncbi:MAG: PD40 domain-containing protein, partial [Gemmatimonadales bacterium]|nr:PD40 domain-containing protein [Gemmatimonadales bacterium]